MRKPLIITRVFEFGGSNAHLKTLIKYFGADNVLLILEDSHQAALLKNVDNENLARFTIIDNLRPYAHLIYPSLLSNIKELAMLIKSLVKLFFFVAIGGISEVVINAVEPEKYLYFLWLPFFRVTYILHSAPQERFTPFTTFTCNSALGRGKRIITVSNSNKEAVCQNWGIAPKKKKYVHVVYNSADEAVKSNKKLPREECAQNVVLTMGHVVDYKNPQLWLRVARHIIAIYHNVHFIWLGNGPLFEEMAAETRTEPRITFRGAVHTPELYLNQAIIYYQPSRHETHGIAVLEAMRCSLPCIVSRAGGLPESVFEQQNGLLVSPGIFDEHVKALITLIENPGLRKTFGECGLIKYQELFSFEKFTLAMDRIYKDR